MSDETQKPPAQVNALDLVKADPAGADRLGIGFFDGKVDVLDGEDGPEPAEDGMEEAEEAREGAQPAPLTLEAAPQDPPATSEPAPAPQAPDAPGESNVISLGNRMATADTDFPGLVLQVYLERNAKTTGESYAGHLRRFLTWCAARGLDLKTMPADTAQTYLEESYPNPVTRNQAIVALRSSFDIGATRGVQFTPQEMRKAVRPPKPAEKPAKPANGVAPRGAPLAAAADIGAGVTPREAVAVPAAVAHAATPRGTPVAAPKKGASAVPSLGGRIRISKRVDGSEGLPGVPVGALVLIGDYAGHDLDGEGRIESFITNHIRPVYGPKFGQRPTVYYVDRLDNLGNPIPGATLNVPIMPEQTPSAAPGGAPPFPAGMTMPGGPQQAAPAPSGITGDRLLDFVISETRRREEEANKRLEEIKAQATKQGMDPTMLMLLVDRVKPEPIDPAKIIAEAKRQGYLKPPREERAEPPPPPMPPGGLGGMDFGMPPPPPPPDAGMEAVTLVLKQQGDMLNALMTRMMQPQAASPQNLGLADLIALAKSLAPPPPPTSALGDKVMEAAIAKMLAPPEKPKSIGETLKEIMALREASEMLGGTPEEKPISFGEVVAAAIENAPAIGQAVATVLSSIPRAPNLSAAPQRRATDQQPQQPAAPPARAPAAPMPKDAQTAFLALKDATDEQEIVNHIFTILSAYIAANAEPWPRAANKLVDDFKKCDTKPEIRAVVTNLFVWSGAKRHMNEANVERITTTLHTHYSMIYGQLAAGEEKVLKDADGAAPQTEQEAVVAAGAEQAASYEEVAAATST